MNRTAAIQAFVIALVLIALQVIVFSRISLWGVATPIVFIYLLMRLPLKMNMNLVLTIAFFSGLIVDIFADTPGLNALASTLTAALRRPIVKLYLPREEDLSDPVPSISSFGFPIFAKYSLTFTLLYTTLVFLIESFSLFRPLHLLLSIIGSTLLTWVLIIAIDSLTTPRNAKRL